MDEAELYGGLTETDQYLVVTEGSSDSTILSAALPIVEPDVADFFHFIDVAENYPFTGTGSVLTIGREYTTVLLVAVLCDQWWLLID